MWWGRLHAAAYLSAPQLACITRTAIVPQLCAAALGRGSWADEAGWYGWLSAAALYRAGCVQLRVPTSQAVAAALL
jgi:hypothetical protein